MLYKPLKRFGQNYLHDKNILNKIYNSIAPQPNDYIIEIGPGYGALTDYFANHKYYLGIEIDKRTYSLVIEKYPNLNFINIDFLKFDFNQLPQNIKYRIIGNIPYNITSPIIFKLLQHHNLIIDVIFMVQYEVAKRICAKPGSDDYSLLTVITDFFMRKEFLFKVSRNCFTPKPNVDSAIIKLTFITDNLDKCNKNLFIQVVKASFGSRRKQLKNSLLNSIFKDYNLENSPVDLSKRAEQLVLNDYIELTKYFYQFMQGEKYEH